MSQGAVHISGDTFLAHLKTPPYDTRVTLWSRPPPSDSHPPIFFCRRKPRAGKSVCGEKSVVEDTFFFFYIFILILILFIAFLSFLSPFSPFFSYFSFFSLYENVRWHFGQDPPPMTLGLHFGPDPRHLICEQPLKVQKNIWSKNFKKTFSKKLFFKFRN